MVSAQDDFALQSILASGGAPSGVLKALETTAELLSTSAPRVWTDSAGPFVVSLDGMISEGEITEDQTHTMIAVEHVHDLREITIQGTTAVPEFPLPVLLAAAGIAETLAWQRLRH